MLPKKSRLSRADFVEVGRGVRLSSPHFSLSYRHRTPSKEGQVAVVISKKVAKRSVDRHLLKRRMLAVLRDYTHQGLESVAYARQGAVSLSFSTLKSEFSDLLKRIPLK